MERVIYSQSATQIIFRVRDIHQPSTSSTFCVACPASQQGFCRSEMLGPMIIAYLDLRSNSVQEIEANCGHLSELFQDHHPKIPLP